MISETIKVERKEKSTTIRLAKSTKRLLESLATGKETNEQILLRLIKLATALVAEDGSKIVEMQNMIGTKYKRVHKTINMDLPQHHYSLVCVFNDLTLFSLLRINKQLLYHNPSGEFPKDWEVQLEIVNIKKDDGRWQQPPPKLSSETSRQYYKSREYVLLYLVSLKKILEETFDIRVYNIVKEEDYFDLNKWEESYKKNSLSMGSFDSDVERKIRELT